MPARVRNLLRPIKSLVMRPKLAAVLHGRKWERKWIRRGKFDWESGGLPPEVGSAIEAGFLEPGMKVLDLGCGSGKGAALLAAHGFEVIGVDVSQTAIARTQRDFADQENVSFLAADITKPDALMGHTFDALIDRGCLHGLPQQLRHSYAANVTRWARDGAPFLLTVHTGSGQSIDIRLAQVARLLGTDWKIEGYEKIEAIRQSGGKSVDGVAIRIRKADS